jgi:hypothetical protein
MRPLNALQRALSTAIREPIVLGAAALVALLQIPVLLSQLLPPLYAAVASLGANLLVLLLAPFTQGGMLGLADGALDGRADFRTFLAEGREHYVSLFAAYLVLIGVTIVVGIAAAILLLVFGVGLGAVASSAGGGSLGGLGLVFAGLLVLITLVFVVAFLFVQFYGQAIVVDECGALESFKRSAGLVRRHFLSTLGYTLVTLLLGGAAGVVIGGVSGLLSGDLPAALGIDASSWPLLAGLLLVVLVLSTLSSAFTSLYSVAFYRDLTPAETDGVTRL